MNRPWPLALVLLAAACGGSAGGTQANQPETGAQTPIMLGNEAETNAAPTDASNAVPRETVMEGPLPAPRDDAYRAIGTEPFWAVTVKGSTATLERPDKAAARFPVVREDDGRAIRYLGEGFSMIVTKGPCSDGMSDAIWSDRVALAFGEGTLRGCGGERDDPQD